MNLQFRLWRFNFALSIYAPQYDRDILMLAHFHVGWMPHQIGFVWFRSGEMEMAKAFGSRFKWLYPRKAKS